MQKKNLFLAKKPEDSALNQYWFSEKTIAFLVDHISQLYQPGFRFGFVSTPSVYCSIASQEVKANSYLFEFDTKFKTEKGFVFYDFNKPKELPPDLQNTFDFLLIDPPFITKPVWTLYAEAAHLLLKQGGRILCCSIKENADLLKELVGVTPRLFKPSIPHLIYQYDFYSNYDHEQLAKVNEEIGF